jgi:carbonic anhydrase/acetyltransferase-like protein (isoleucine patch superfamily)
VIEAIIIVGSGPGRSDPVASNRLQLQNAACGDGIATTEILGQSVLQRMVADLKKAKVDQISVCADAGLSSDVDGVKADVTAWESGAERLRWLADRNSELALIFELSAYVELDFVDLLSFHQESGKAVTRVFHESGPVGLWAVSPAAFPGVSEMRSVLDDIGGVEYYTSGYINRLETPADLRRLVSDGLGGRCRCRPQGFEVKPGIWMAPGAMVEKAARVVAPAFIGRGVNIGDECLITRGSNVESDSEVDYGTTIEASSILSNTYVGIGLDLSHSIVQGSNLLNLQHEVVLRISDPAVMRQNKKSATEGQSSLLNFGVGEAIPT